MAGDFYDEPERAVSPWLDVPNIRRNKRFQSDSGLRVDSVICPGGKTERALEDRLRARYEKLTAERRQASWRRSSAARTKRSGSLLTHAEPFGASPSLAGSDDRSTPAPRGKDGRAVDTAPAEPGTGIGRSVRPAVSADDALQQYTLDRIEKHYRNIVAGWRSRGYTTAADNLEWYLDGRGGVRRLSRDEAIEFAWVREADEKNNQRFVEGTFTGKTKDPSVRKLLELMPGDLPIRFKDDWDAEADNFEFLQYYLGDDPDFALAFGRTELKSTGNFRARFRGDLIVVDGTITHAWEDDFDFHPGQPGADGALALKQDRGAHPFKTQAKWAQPIQVHLKRDNGTLVLARKIIWGKVKEIY